MQNKVAILGAGESGVGAAMLALQEGYAVWVSEKGSISEERKALLEGKGIAYEEGKHTEDEILDADLIIKSPGISEKIELVQRAIENGIPVIDELEFAFRFAKGRVIAISGTNGKTTTTLLTHHLMMKGEIKVGLAGNIGKSWASQLVEGDQDWWVLEVSSFQLDGIKTFRPTIAILTNITPDHLDRYDNNVDNYIESKISIFKNMGELDTALYYEDDVIIRKGIEKSPIKAKKLPVSITDQPEYGALVSKDAIQFKLENGSFEVLAKDIAISGQHNMLNAALASIAAFEAGVTEDKIREGLADFVNAPHRMEKVADINGVTYINDSKGTNVDATAYALASIDSPIIWIAGGVDKGNNYEALHKLVGKVKLLICLGVDNSKLEHAFSGKIETIKETQDINQAVILASEVAGAGDVVILSPACASFDLFKNYEDRGSQFKAAVKNLKESAL